MAWDDAPPEATGWDAAAPTPEELKPSYLEDVGNNALREIKAIPGSIPGMVKQGLGVASAPLDALKAIPQMLGGKSLADTDVAEDIKPVIEGNKNTVHTIAHPVDSFREAPISTAGTLMGLLGGMFPEGETVPRETIPAETVPKEPLASGPPKELPVVPPGSKTGDPHALFAYNDKFGPGGTERSLYNIFGDPEHPVFKEHGWGSSVPKEDLGDIPVTGRQPGSERFEPLEPPKVVPMGGKEVPPEPASRVPPDPNAPPAPEPTKPFAASSDAATKANEVKDYISKGYEGYAKKPGAASEIADYVQEKSQMMAAQQMGATPLQARQIGHEGMRAIGQYALDNDIVSPTTGLKGMRAKTTALNEAAGKTIGDIRAQADTLRVPAEHNVDVLQAVRQKFDPIFSRGTRSGESGAYAKVLEELEDAKPTFQGMSDLSTKLNKAANEANRLNQPHGVYTDIANEISHINNERIKALVGPEKAATYEQALRDFGATKKIGEFLKRKEAGEVKRMGPGSLTSNLTQKALDEFGYRAGAKIANKVSSAIKRNPGITKNIPSLFKEFTNQVEDVSHEVTGMSEGGVVPDDVKRYVQSRGC